MFCLNSPDVEADSDNEYIKPAKKKAAIGDIYDNLPVAPSKPATSRKVSASTTSRKPSGSKSVPEKKASKKNGDSDYEIIDYADSPPPAPTARPGKRPVRAAPKKYIEIVSDEDDDEGGDKDSMYDD